MHIKGCSQLQSCASSAKRVVPLVAFAIALITLAAIYATVHMGPLRNLSRPLQAILITLGILGSGALFYLMKPQERSLVLLSLSLSLLMIGLLARLDVKGFTSFSHIASRNLMILGGSALGIALLAYGCHKKICNSNETVNDSAPDQPHPAKSKKRMGSKRPAPAKKPTAVDQATFLAEFDQTLKEGDNTGKRHFDDLKQDRSARKILQLLRSAPMRPHEYITCERFQKILWLWPGDLRLEAFQTKVLSILFMEKKDLTLLRGLHEERWLQAMKPYLIRSIQSRFCEVTATMMHSIKTDQRLQKLSPHEVSTLCILSHNFSEEAIEHTNYWNQSSIRAQIDYFQEKWGERIKQFIKLAAIHFDSPNDQIRIDVENMVIHLIQVGSHLWHDDSNGGLLHNTHLDDTGRFSPQYLKYFKEHGNDVVTAQIGDQYKGQMMEYSMKQYIYSFRIQRTHNFNIILSESAGAKEIREMVDLCFEPEEKGQYYAKFSTGELFKIFKDIREIFRDSYANDQQTRKATLETIFETSWPTDLIKILADYSELPPIESYLPSEEPAQA